MDQDPMQPHELSLEELAVSVGVDASTVLGWHRLGLLVGDGERFSLQDLERSRLILYAERRGISVDEIVEACRTQGDLLSQFVKLVVGDNPRRGRRIEDAAGATGLDPATLHSIWVASGFGDQEEVYDEDLDALRTVGAVLAAGLPEDALVQLVRVLADALGRVAEAENRLFHYYVHERLRSQGLSGEDLGLATSAVSDPIIGLIEPTVLYFHRKAFQRELRDDFVLHLTEATTPPGEAIGEMTATILFVDLSGFTPMTESMGDVAAARVVARFSDLVREAAGRHDGKVVKQIGDEFMLVFTDPADAVRFGLAVDHAVSAESHFPGLRIGAHHGSLLYREGDYIGTTVNIAARVTAAAKRHEFLVTDALRLQARLPPNVEVVAVGGRALKGISGEVALHQIRHGSPRDRMVDPVCHMLLDPATVGATVSWRGTDLKFCSTTCAERFQAQPEQYGGEA